MAAKSKRDCYLSAWETIADMDNEDVLDAINTELGGDIDRIILDSIGYDIVKNPFAAMFLRGFYLGVQMQKHKLEEGGEKREL